MDTVPGCSLSPPPKAPLLQSRGLCSTCRNQQQAAIRANGPNCLPSEVIRGTGSALFPALTHWQLPAPPRPWLRQTEERAACRATQHSIGGMRTLAAFTSPPGQALRCAPRAPKWLRVAVGLRHPAVKDRATRTHKKCQLLLLSLKIAFPELGGEWKDILLLCSTAPSPAQHNALLCVVP